MNNRVNILATRKKHKLTLVFIAVSILLGGGIPNLFAFISPDIGITITEAIRSQWVYIFVLFLLSYLLNELYLARESAANAINLIGKSHQLKPEQLGFTVKKIGELSRASENRPWYPKAIPVMRSLKDLDLGYELSINELRKNLGNKANPISYAIINQPTEGKTSFAYLTLSGMRNYWLVKPEPTMEQPLRKDFKILRGKQVVIFIDDLDKFVSSTLKINEFVITCKEEVGEKNVVVLCTCRSGLERSIVGSSSSTSRLFSVLRKVSLIPLNNNEKKMLVDSIGLHQLQNFSTYSTPGDITLENAFSDMRERFVNLSHTNGICVEIFNTCRAMYQLGITTYSRELIQAFMGIVLSDQNWFNYRRKLIEADFANDGNIDSLDLNEAYLKCIAKNYSPSDLIFFTLNASNFYFQNKKYESLFQLLKVFLDYLVLDNIEKIVEVFIKYSLIFENTYEVKLLGAKIHLINAERHKNSPEYEIEIEKAINDLNTAIELKSNNFEAKIELGIIFVDLFRLRSKLASEKELEKAIEFFTQGTKLNPNQPKAFYYWGVASDELQELEKTYSEEYSKKIAEKFEYATQLDPDFIKAYMNWGVILRKIGERKSKLEKYEKEKYFRSAIEKFERATQLDSKFALAFSNWGSVLYSLAELCNKEKAEKMYLEAVEKLQQAIKINPKFSNHYQNLGSTLNKLGGLKKGLEAEKLHLEAIEKYKKAIQIDSSSALAYNGWGYCLYCLGRLKDGIEAKKFFSEASEKYQKSIFYDSSSALAYSNWGLVYLHLSYQKPMLNRENELLIALEKFAKALEIDPFLHYAKENMDLVSNQLKKISVKAISQEINPPAPKLSLNSPIAVRSLKATQK